MTFDYRTLIMKQVVQSSQENHQPTLPYHTEEDLQG